MRNVLVNSTLIILILHLHLAFGNNNKAAKLRGVEPKDYDKYNVNDDDSWRCLNSDVTIKGIDINDDYCDCPDGSDEPGTSACSMLKYERSFYCHNEGYIPSKIHLSRVDDGVCDQEYCCDGSDEINIDCPNTCKQKGEEYKKDQIKSSTIKQKAIKVKSSYIDLAKQEIKKLDNEIESKVNLINKQEQIERSTKMEVDRLEKLSADSLSAKLATPLYKHLLDSRDIINRLVRAKEENEIKLRELISILESLKGSYNPNYQDMGVLNSIRDFDSFLSNTKHTNGVNNDILNDDITNIQKTDLVNILLTINEVYNNDEGNKGKDLESILFNLENYLPGGFIEKFRNFKTTIVNYFVKFGIIPHLSNNVDGPHIQKARKEHKKSSEALDKSRIGLAKLQAEKVELESGIRWGQNGEWNALNKQCMTKDIAEYTYEFCWFDKVLQRQQGRKSGGTTIGKFKSWNEDANIAGSEEFYSQQIYTSGQRCWNGPERSAIVDILCGEDNTLLEVEELEKCAYSLLVTSPAACNQDTTHDSIIVRHDEL